MAHLMARYRVTITVRGDRQPLGDFHNGHSLLGFLPESLAAVDVDGAKSTLATEDDVYLDDPVIDVTLRTGEKGVRSDIEKSDAVVPRYPDDTERLRAFALFRVPAANHEGMAVFHQPHGRGIKSLLADHLKKDFRNRFDGAALHLDPCVDASELRELMQDGRMKKIRLRHKRHPADDFDGLDDYADPEEVGKVEVAIQPPRGRFMQRRGQLLERLLEQSHEGEQLIFDGVEYDELSVEVQRGNRTKIIQVIPHLGAGNLNYEVDDNLVLDQGEPTRETLRKAAISLLD